MNIFGPSIEELEKESIRQQLSNMNVSAAMLGKYLTDRLSAIEKRLEALEKKAQGGE